jgi:hypothetical protein
MTAIASISIRQLGVNRSFRHYHQLLARNVEAAAGERAS